MTQRRVLCAGVAMGVALVIAAAFSGRFGAQFRRPLFDGFQPVPPYRWVNPPQEFAAANKPALAMKTAITVKPPSFGAGVYSTGDQQATFLVEADAWPRSRPQPFTLTIDPRDPGVTAKSPVWDGPKAPYRFLGNLYELMALDRGREAVVTLGSRGQILLQYPILGDGTVQAGHTVLVSDDAATWHALESVDQPVTQQVSAYTSSVPRYMAAGVPQAAAASPKPVAPKRSAPVGIIVAIGVVVLVALAAAGYGFRARTRRVKRSRRRRR